MSTKELYTLHADPRESFGLLSSNRFHGAPTRMQHRLMSTVATALIQCLFYTSKVYAYVCNEMSDVLTPEILDSNYKNSRVEHGHFGMEIYYARQAVESNLRDEANRGSLSQLVRMGFVKVGGKIKGPFSFAQKKFSSLTVESLDASMGTVTMIGVTRGRGGSFRITVEANRSDFLELFPLGVTDDTVKTQQGDGMITMTVDFCANRQKELFSQIAA